MKIINILLIFTLFTNSFSIIKLPFRIESNYDQNFDDIILKLVNKKIFIDIKIGSKKTQLSLPLKLHSYSSFISSSNNTNLKIKTFNEKESNTYKLINDTIIKPLLDDYEEGLLSEDDLYLNNNIELKNFNFILSIKQNLNSSGYIGLNLEKDFSDHELFENTGFINQLKKLNLINSYSFTFKFLSNDKGEFIIGGDPHEYDKKNYNSDNLILINAGKINNYMKWYFDIDNIKVNEDNVEYTTHESAEIQSEFGLIIGSDYFRLYVWENFFNKNGCNFGTQGIYDFYYCDKKVNIKNLFKKLEIYSKDKKIKFIFDNNDLFYEYKGKIYFLIVFTRGNYWTFGQIFLKKYQTIFNSDKKVLGWYTNDLNKNNKNNNKKENNKILKIFCIIFLIIIICLILYIFLFKKNLKLFRRVMINELTDTFESKYDKIDNNSKNKLINKY